jgi:hypothetical protein
LKVPSFSTVSCSPPIVYILVDNLLLCPFPDQSSTPIELRNVAKVAGIIKLTFLHVNIKMNKCGISYPIWIISMKIIIQVIKINIYIKSFSFEHLY